MNELFEALGWVLNSLICALVCDFGFAFPICCSMFVVDKLPYNFILVKPLNLRGGCELIQELLSM